MLSRLTQASINFRLAEEPHRGWPIDRYAPKAIVPQISAGLHSGGC